MSTAAKADAAPAGAGKTGDAPKKKGKLLIIIGAAVVLLAGGGAAFWFLRPHHAANATEATAAGGQAAAEPSAPKAAPIYYKFDPAFIVNFGGEGNVRYLQITLEAMSRDPKVVEEIKNNEPAIRNDLVLLFSAQQYDALLAAEGKEKLRQATLEAVRKAVAAESGKSEAIEGVYFTSFVIQ
jgi:flagellar FliL protein